jgi:hypothetical protein
MVLAQTPALLRAMLGIGVGRCAMSTVAGGRMVVPLTRAVRTGLNREVATNSELQWLLFVAFV